jgi:hypothetical protein
MPRVAWIFGGDHAGRHDIDFEYSRRSVLRERLSLPRDSVDRRRPVPPEKSIRG